MSSESRSSPSRRGNEERTSPPQRGNSRENSPRRHEEDDDRMPTKIFVTNLEAGNPQQIEEELRSMFEKYGDIANCVVKNSHNREYCFAFIDYKEGGSLNCVEAMKKLNGVALGDKPMKVELQDNSRRRKTNAEGCYKCGKPGHFARECRGERMDDRDRDRDRYRDRRGRSRSRSKDRKKKKSHHRHRSESSESRHRKKDKKKHKSHKKHKKSKKKHYSSDSDSSN